ncbi:PSD1 and planctomycete cytochrome C domain-containing protein [Planctomicrobium piriforme]|uniref:Planctomycete cytochrome C n=1 Tax=Planctomicrobium piriforme TaxID=1576369 RepID=A0A1I3MIE0_9PLAN|nr:PSD1 and planctomycete cytochrome C domain-containing protein [Planctomicrobium piriforme]SFI96914.1 Planctomycete cytochrome C [Planctomicrobium piriforme]
MLQTLPRPCSLLQVLLAWCAFSVGAAAADSAHKVDFALEIQPLLKEKCVFCHGPLKQEADLRLDAAALLIKGGDSGSAVKTDVPADSLILERILAAEGERMPPVGEGDPLTGEEVARLRAWITAGAPVPPDEKVLSGPEDHWAYHPPVQAELPTVSRDDWNQHPVDRFIARQHEKSGLTPVPQANRRELLRRIYLDLIGLPPTPAQMEDFLADASSDAYEKVVDQLLASPQYGERWGRHWMDVWRYSDWDGYRTQVRGSQRHIWRWRDWIVESLNADKGYDAMIREMLAGDEIAPTDEKILRATGFLARNYHNSNREIWMDATVEHTAKAFLGITINCARCHDHKYDPISQADYYRFRAIFEPYNVRVDRLPGTRDLTKDGLPRIYDAHAERETLIFEGGDERRAIKDKPVAPGVPEVFKADFDVQPVELPEAAWATAFREFIEKEDVALFEAAAKTSREKLDQLTKSSPGSVEHERAELKLQIDELTLASLQARWLADKAKYFGESTDGSLDALTRNASRKEREIKLVTSRLALLDQEVTVSKLRTTGEEEGNEKKLTDAEAALVKAQADITAKQKDLEEDAVEYTAIGKAYPARSTGRRTALADWLASTKNPLTARVAVNHIWLRHFGQPLVENVFDFGLNSPEPPYAALLDWLAVELMKGSSTAQPWSMKHVHRLIVTSQAYRLSSHADVTYAANRGIDSDNRLLWKREPQRLEAEVVRDSVLAVAGSLDCATGGPDLDFTEGETVFRRSLYFRTAYEKQMLLLTLFDAANPGDCYRRSTSVIPQQALALANSPITLGQARTLAGEIWTDVQNRTSKDIHPRGADTGIVESHDASPPHPQPLSPEYRGEGSSKSDSQKQAEPDYTFIDQAFERILSRPPSESERQLCHDFLAAQAQRLSDAASLTPIAGGPAPKLKASDDPHQRARENLVHVLFNHNDFVTVR